MYESFITSGGELGWLREGGWGEGRMGDKLRGTLKGEELREDLGSVGGVLEIGEEVSWGDSRGIGGVVRGKTP